MDERKTWYIAIARADVNGALSTNRYRTREEAEQALPSEIEKAGYADLTMVADASSLVQKWQARDGYGVAQFWAQLDEEIPAS